MKRFLFVLTLLALLGGARQAVAQVSGVAVGPKLGFYLSSGKVAVGGIAEFPITRELDFEPGIEAVLGLQYTSLFILDANLRYSFTIPGEVIRPYVLGGLGIAHTSIDAGGTSLSSTDLQLNLGGGVVFNSRSLVQYWAGLKLYFLNGSDVLLQGGVLFYL
jgi:hypothetical protein